MAGPRRDLGFRAKTWCTRWEWGKTGRGVLLPGLGMNGALRGGGWAQRFLQQLAKQAPRRLPALAAKCVGEDFFVHGRIRGKVVTLGPEYRP